MKDQYDLLQTKLGSLQTKKGASPPGDSNQDDIELLWNEITTLQATITDAVQKTGEAVAMHHDMQATVNNHEEDLGEQKAAAEQHMRVSAAALAALEDQVSARTDTYAQLEEDVTQVRKPHCPLSVRLTAKLTD